ncbi:DUF2383 domain-containing protein [Polyangium aurulentum]|uniref:DUF2383 domain-containing protein n=1 Tax=Polyangium aurulentum TaxID=2567896 RepID=UPI0010ADF285|nr:DUF2383 domain-containing protein [Polyangium aurulentum]UQA58287.1 ferritin-like domain-containing protein [Polyangium aurulentum]
MKILEKLNSLIMLDVDAVHAYDQAIEACEILTVKDTLTEFRNDHERHIHDLSEQVRALGGTPEVHRDLKGFVIEGFTALMSRGDHSALLAMRGNEELTNRVYKAALEMEDLSPEARTVIERNYADEQRHVSWINNQLSARVWERKAA